MRWTTVTRSAFIHFLMYLGRNIKYSSINQSLKIVVFQFSGDQLVENSVVCWFYISWLEDFTIVKYGLKSCTEVIHTLIVMYCLLKECSKDHFIIVKSLQEFRIRNCLWTLDTADKAKKLPKHKKIHCRKVIFAGKAGWYRNKQCSATRILSEDNCGPLWDESHYKAFFLC